jgi:hypothetical protein
MLYLLNHYLFQKLKLIGNNKFNHLINTLTLSLIYELKLLSEVQHVEYLIKMEGKWSQGSNRISDVSFLFFWNFKPFFSICKSGAVWEFLLHGSLSVGVE